MRFLVACLALSLLATVPSVAASGYTAYVEYSGPYGEFSGERQVKIMDFVYLSGWGLGGGSGCMGGIATFHPWQVDQGSTWVTIQAMGGIAKLYVDGVAVVSTLGPTVAEIPLSSAQVHVTLLFDFSTAPSSYAQVVSQLRGMVAIEPAACLSGPDSRQDLNSDFKDSREAARDAYKAGKANVDSKDLREYNRAYQETRQASLELFKQAQQGLR